MKKPITITLPHQHTRAEAKKRIRGGLERMASTLGGLGSVTAEEWQGDEMGFRMTLMRQEASGRLLVNDDSVVVNVYLPWALHTIAEKLRGQIEKTGTQVLLEDKKK